MISDESKFEPYNIQSTIESLGEIMSYLNSQNEKTKINPLIEDLKIIIKLSNQLPREAQF